MAAGRERLIVRVLVADLERVWRGGQEQALALLDGLRARGHGAELVTVRGSTLGERAREHGIAVHEVSPRTPRPAAARKLRELLRAEPRDIVHTNEAHALTASWFARAHRQAMVIASRRVAFPLQKHALARAQYRSAQRTIAVSQFVARSLAGGGLPPRSVRVVYDGVALPPPGSDAARRRARARWGAAEGQRLIGCVGHLLPEKGQEFLIRAMPEMAKRAGNCRLVLAGDGRSRSRLERLAGEVGVSGAVHFAGEVKDVAEVYRALDIFVFPSLAEPLGSSLLTAMAWALPAVAAEGGAVPEVIEAGRNGVLVPPRDPAAIAESVARLLAEPERARALGQAARRTIEERFTADRMVDATLAVYAEVVREPHGAAASAAARR